MNKHEAPFSDSDFIRIDFQFLVLMIFLNRQPDFY